MQGIPSIRYQRNITGMSAILLPILPDGELDWESFCGHVARTSDAGLVPAINMDTGYANLISQTQRREALRLAWETLSGKRFLAGVFVGDQPGAAFDLDAYRQRIDEVVEYSGTPILFQSYGLTGQEPTAIVDSYAAMGSLTSEFYAFELGNMFAPFGAIYSLDVYRRLMEIPQCLGAKHSSLSRNMEWERLQLRDSLRPDFLVLTGNDLAIDMVMYGSDYLLGLSTFAPTEFALRDAMWKAGDPRFYELNDLLQYLGCFSFRPPVPAYKHNAAQFLHARGFIQSPRTFRGSPERPNSDLEVLHKILEQLQPYENLTVAE